MSKVTTKFLKSTIKDGEFFDESTKHKITEVNGELVEMKYCPYCRQWLTLDKFNPSKNQYDGYIRTCKHCTTVYRQKTIERVEMEQEEAEQERRPIDYILDAVNREIETRVQDYKDAIYILEEENKELRAKLEGSKDITKLSEREIETVLKHNSIPPRLLFDAIKRIDDRYTFTCHDNVSGLTHSIVSEEVCSTNKICN